MSDHDETETAKSIPQWVGRVPSLSNFHTPLPNLAGHSESDHQAAVVRLAELLGATPDRLTVRIQINDGEQARSWLLDAGPTGCQVTDDVAQQANVEAILDQETWSLLASGRMSPLEAFARGRMRVRGDMKTARRLSQHLYHRDASES